MTIKKTALGLGLLLLVAAVCVLFWPTGSRSTVSMPLAPERVAEPGRYSLGDGRYIEITSGKGGIEYWKGQEEIPDSSSSDPQIVSYSAQQFPAVKLGDGWSIEFTPPDQLKIWSGNGEIFQRTYGADRLSGDSSSIIDRVTRTRIEDRNAQQAAPN